MQGAWIAIRGEIGVASIILGLSVMAWVSGFDILYALQDLEFDKKEGLYSIPAKFGVKASISIAKLLHVLMLASLIALKYYLGLSILFTAGTLLIGFMLLYEHWLLRDGLEKLDAAFFNMNGYISVVMFITTSLEVFVGWHI